MVTIVIVVDSLTKGQKLSKLEKLRRENERLRDCGIYWHDACKEAVRDLIGKKKTR